MKKKTLGRIAGLIATLKAPKVMHVLRHPIKGTRNLLALRGARSLLKTRGAAVTAAAVATTAIATPLAVKALKDKSDS